MKYATLELTVNWHADGEYIPAVTNALPEDCHPAEEPEIEIDDILLNGSKIELKDEHYDSVHEMLCNEIESWSRDNYQDSEVSITLEDIKVHEVVKISNCCKNGCKKPTGVIYNGQDITALLSEDELKEILEGE